MNISAGRNDDDHDQKILHQKPSNDHSIQYSPTVQLPTNAKTPTCTSRQQDHHHQPASMKVVRYKECLKNHAAAIGGNARDGCGEFMPSGEDGSIEALNCSACNCHRNFHRKDTEPDCSFQCYHSPILRENIIGPKSSQRYPLPSGTLITSTVPQHHQMIISYGSGSFPSESDEQGDGVVVRPAQVSKKRFRTKFTKQHKEKMLTFADKAGWRLQNVEESAVQELCQEIGIKRRVLKVWMHNNKHNYSQKNSTSAA